MKDTLHGLPSQSLVPRVVKKLNFDIENSDKFRHRKLVSCRAFTLYPPTRNECRPGWNQNKQLSTQAFETDEKMMHISPLSRWPLINDSFTDLCSIDARLFNCFPDVQWNLLSVCKNEGSDDFCDNWVSLCSSNKQFANFCKKSCNTCRD